MINVYEVTTKKQKNDFFRFPHQLYKNHAYFVPPIISEEKDEFDPLKNGAFEYAETKMFIAYKDGKVAGRIAGLLNKAYNEKMNEKQLRFTRWDVIDDLAVTTALFEKVTDWATSLGMDKVIGPIGFSDLDKQGLLIEGFDQLDLYLTLYNYPYYQKHLEALGFSKLVDWVEYRIEVPETIDERFVGIVEKVQSRFGYRYLPVEHFKDIESYMHTALSDVMNEVYADLFGVVPINARQIAREVDMLKMIFNKDFVCAVFQGEELVGYGFMAPSLSKAMQKMKGRLLPFGVFHFLKATKRFDVVDLYSIGVKKAHQSKGVNAMIMLHGLKSLVKYKVKYVETGPELETNNQIQSQWKDFKKTQHRRRRCFVKLLENHKTTD